MKWIIILILTLILSGCGTLSNIFDTSKETPTKVITIVKTKYKVLPDEFINCPPPPVYNENYILSVENESEYNSVLVARLFGNLSLCYENMQHIKEFNEQNKKLNEEENLNNE